MTPLPADDAEHPGHLPLLHAERGFLPGGHRPGRSRRSAAVDWQLRIHGMVDQPMTLTFDELIKLPMIEQDITLTCVSEAVGGGYVGNARWQGTLLADVLRKAGIQSGADQIVMRDVKGMTIGVATEPVMDGRKSLLAVGMNGQLLPQAHGYPVRVVVPGLYGYVSATKWVVDMEFTTFGAFNAYWVKQGWSQQAADQDGIPHRRAEGPQQRGRGPGDDRRRRLGAAPRHRGRRGVRRRRLVRGETPRPGHHRYLASVVLRLGRHPRAARAPGAGHRQDRLHPDRGDAEDPAERRDRIPHHPGHASSHKPADGAHPLCAPSAIPRARWPPPTPARVAVSGHAGLSGPEGLSGPAGQ